MGVQRIVLEGALHEEGPSLPEQRAQGEEGQVHPGRYDRYAHPVLEERIRQDEVVEMALVTGNVHDGAVPGHFLHGLDARLTNIKPVVDIVENPGQGFVQEIDRGG